MELTDEQLMLLEQLTYLDKDVADQACVDLDESASTVAEIIEPFLKKPGALDKLQNSTKETISGGVMQGNEWAAIIRAVEDDPELMNLNVNVTYTGKSNKTIDKIVFTEENGDPKQAVVAFRGTLDGKEWNDNFYGFDHADTPCQQEALRFINGLPYDDITVVGHSKGGNKAQYVTLLSDKVTRCLSMDGQGFSPEFLEKYWAEIQARGGLINNYSLSNDFVHGIIYRVPGSNQVYFLGDGMASAAENHSPCSYFQFIFDKDGNAILSTTDGHIRLIECDEDGGLVYIHQFFNYVENNMTDEERASIRDLLGPILAMTIGGGIQINGVDYSGSEDAIKYLSAHQDSAAILLGYLFKYVYTYELSDKEIADMLRSFGFGEIADGFEKFAKDHPKLYELAGGSLRKIIEQLGDGKDDKIINAILKELTKLLKDKGIDIDLVKLWKDTEDVYSSIEIKDKEAAIAEPTLRKDKTYDYSKEAYDAIMSTITDFQNCLFDIVDWSKYESEKWYNSFFISLTMKAVNGYIDGVYDEMNEAKTLIEKAFENEWNVDDSSAGKITPYKSAVVARKGKYKSLITRLK